MSVVSKPKVFEAELIAPAPVNPFASPGVQHSAVTDCLVATGIGRASLREIHLVIRSLIASDISYFAVWIAWLVSTVWMCNLTVWIWIGMTLVAWFCFARMAMSHGEFDLLTFATIFSFPVPLLGVVIFFAARRQACRFLVWNGYKPDMFGASPDYDEINAMNADPRYRPSIRWCRNGARRRMAVSINHALVGFLIFSMAAIAAAAILI